MKRILSYKFFIISLFINTICDINLFNAHETPLKLVYHRWFMFPLLLYVKVHVVDPRLWTMFSSCARL